MKLSLHPHDNGCVSIARTHQSGTRPVPAVALVDAIPRQGLIRDLNDIDSTVQVPVGVAKC